MTLTGSLPTEDAAGLSIDDWRLIQAGMIAKAADGSPRLGVLPAHTGPLVTGTAGMAYEVAAHHAVTSRTGDGVEHVANDGPVSVSTTAAPGSNSRIDVIWERCRFDMYTDDGEYAPEFGVTQGTADLSPTKPTIPAGALELAVATVTSTDVATSTTVITQTHPYTAAEGATVLVRNSTERSGWTPKDGSYCFQLDTTLGYDRVAAGWVPSHREVVESAPGAVLVGSIPPVGARLIRKRGLIAVSTNANGDVGFTYPNGAFPNGVIWVSLQRHNFAARPPTHEVLNSTQSLSQLNWRVFNVSGVAQASLSFGYVFEAVGW